MSAHTPWVVESVEGRAQGTDFTQHTVRPNICSVFYFDKKGEEIARLIAAAPELLKDLQQMIAWEDGERTAIDALVNARAIVAKATGGDV